MAWSTPVHACSEVDMPLQGKGTYMHLGVYIASVWRISACRGMRIIFQTLVEDVELCAAGAHDQTWW